MIYQLEYSPCAMEDLMRIRSEVWQACRDSETTLHYLDDLMDTAEKTILFPKSASPLYFENRFTGYYRVPYKAYLIFYRLDGSRVLIERILHSGTDYLKRSRSFDYSFSGRVIPPDARCRGDKSGPDDHS